MTKDEARKKVLEKAGDLLRVIDGVTVRITGRNSGFSLRVDYPYSQDLDFGDTDAAQDTGKEQDQS